MAKILGKLTGEKEKREILEGKHYGKEDFRQYATNYLVEAGAGAGKTYTMVARIINQLTSGYCEPQDIVAITFTNKSTLEMQERLDKELRDCRDKAVGEERERLEKLVRESSRMQVSTIDSFCQTMLDAMPFATPFGTDRKVMDSDDDYAKEYLTRRMRSDTELFAWVMAFGVKRSMLETFFVERCANGRAKMMYCTDAQKIAAWEQQMQNSACALQNELISLPAKTAEKLDEGLRKIREMAPAAFANDEAAVHALAWKVLYYPGKCPLSWSALENKKLQDAFRKEPEGAEVDKIWNGANATDLRKSAGLLLHARLMPDMEKLLHEYREEKAKNHVATFDDLLLYTRDMLRDNAEARRYFHKRYKVLYVDEMQDTNPVQAEILFYLTADEDGGGFDPSDWRKCRPVPGSLFLVGDPKQAIYRFRGADIDVYNTLRGLFQSEADRDHNGIREYAIGQEVKLRYNFRSAQEICALADRVFQPDALADEESVAHQMNESDYQTDYTSMEARNGSCVRARTVRYEAASGKVNGAARATKIEDMQVAAFIREMIDRKVILGCDSDKPDKQPHPARASDFLILTSAKANAEKYAAMLKVLGVACDMTGTSRFLDARPIEKATLHLRSLLARRDERKLVRVLRECYGVTDAGINRLLKRSEKKSLSGLLREEPLLQSLYAALKMETPSDSELIDLCVALKEIFHLRYLADTKPAMAVIEQLLEGGYGVWEDSLTGLEGRREDYRMVQQYLNLLRGQQERSFPALAAYAIECAEKTFDHQLELEPVQDAVRIMNLHKAKGLEGEVVILAESTKPKHEVSRHIVRSAGQVLEYSALVYTKDHFSGTVTLAWPEGWERVREEEQRYLDAEYDRLLYVAATRAKTLLVVCGKAGEEKTKSNYWNPLLDHLQKADPNDGCFGDSFKALLTAQPALWLQTRQAVKAAGASIPAPVPVIVHPEAMEEILAAQCVRCGADSPYAVTPSRLEHEARGVILRRDEENEAPMTSRETLSEIGGEVPASKTEGPYGADWGTIFHRVMELAVRNQNYGSEMLLQFARQAVSEVLPGGVVTPRQRVMLRLADTAEGEPVIVQLAGQAASIAGELLREGSPLRQLMSRGKGCYPELTFFLREEDTGSELYRHLSAHIGSADAAGKTLDVQGIIDLAIRLEDGWYVVDYKTDKMACGETEAQFRQRLKEHYTAQITAYARVLERMGQGSVKGAWLCSVPLGGTLVELELAGRVKQKD